MKTTHLILGNSNDYHARAVHWALRKLGCEAWIWDGVSREADGHISFFFEDKRRPMRMGGKSVISLKSAWFRRPVKFRDRHDVAGESRKFVENEVSDAQRTIDFIAERKAEFVVGGSRGLAAQSKVFQLEMARSIGLKIPTTLVSNDYDDVMDFLKANSSVVVKNFTPHVWAQPEGKTVVTAVTKIDENTTLDKASVEICPTIYQACVEKKYDVRVTVIGKRLFATKILSGDGLAYLDWRQHMTTKAAKVFAYEIDQPLTSQILELMARLNLSFGCIDLAAGVDGSYYFLEVNPGGQFLFNEFLVAELPLLRAFASMLLAGSAEYPIVWDEELTVKAFDESEECFTWFKNRDPSAFENPAWTTVC